MHAARRARGVRGARSSKAVRLLAAVLALIALSFHAHSDPPDLAPVLSTGEHAWIGANDLARLLGATKFWRHDVRKLVLRTGEHRLAEEPHCRFWYKLYNATFVPCCKPSVLQVVLYRECSAHESMVWLATITDRDHGGAVEHYG